MANECLRKCSVRELAARGAPNKENTRTEPPWAVLQTILANSLNIAAAVENRNHLQRIGFLPVDDPVRISLKKLDRFSRQTTPNVTGAGVSR